MRLNCKQVTKLQQNRSSPATATASLVRSLKSISVHYRHRRDQWRRQDLRTGRAGSRAESSIVGPQTIWVNYYNNNKFSSLAVSVGLYAILILECIHCRKFYAIRTHSVIQYADKLYHCARTTTQSYWLQQTRSQVVARIVDRTASQQTNIETI